MTSAGKLLLWTVSPILQQDILRAIVLSNLKLPSVRMRVPWLASTASGAHFLRLINTHVPVAVCGARLVES